MTNTTPDTNAADLMREREAFEAWEIAEAAKYELTPRLMRYTSHAGCEEPNYMSEAIQYEWNGWKARALAAPIPRDPVGWQPIATAPEGTMILCANMKATEARNWAYVAWMAGGKVHAPWRVEMPTHWTHLPTPPAMREQGADHAD